MKKAKSTITSITGTREVKIEITGNDAHKHIKGISKVVQDYLLDNIPKEELRKEIDNFNKKLAKVKKHKDGIRVFNTYSHSLAMILGDVNIELIGTKVLDVTLDTINCMGNQGCDFETASDAVKASDRLANIAHSILSGE